jgi:hypothetical protein
VKLRGSKRGLGGCPKFNHTDIHCHRPLSCCCAPQHNYIYLIMLCKVRQDAKHEFQHSQLPRRAPSCAIGPSNDAPQGHSFRATKWPVQELHVSAIRCGSVFVRRLPCDHDQGRVRNRRDLVVGLVQAWSARFPGLDVCPLSGQSSEHSLTARLTCPASRTKMAYQPPTRHVRVTGP